MASSSSSATSPAFEYDVFISFSGEDTRTGFTSHLRRKLWEKGIKTYKDDEDLERGDEISQGLKKAIETSKIYVIIFSNKYASSSWCLDELVHILECRQKYNQTVLPVFFHIDPSDVRKQKGSYEYAFDIHEERFGNEMDKVHKWRDALTASANLAGWHSEPLQVVRDESDLVERIVKEILSKIKSTQSTDDFNGLVGITKRIAQIESLLCNSSSVDVWKVGIWGCGGIGKTTLARAVFDRHSCEFENSCFLSNVREEWGKGHKHDLKKKLFSELLKEKNPNMGTLSLGSTYDKDRLCRKKVFIVLDDVDRSEQLKFLIEDSTWFGRGSKIIITTRDMQVLRGVVNEIYKAERLNYEEALQLFQLNAFQELPPREDLLHLFERVVKYTDGIPLALEVLGSFLHGKKYENWKQELNKLEECPLQDIQRVLRISYNGLDKKQKSIFLDIACFFKGLHRDCAEGILDACRSFAKSGIDDLIDKSLITIKDDNKLWMHDLIQEMGWEIEKSNEEISRRRRLWDSEDVYHVLETNIGVAKIEGIVLDMWNMVSEVHPAAFEHMYKLRLLKIVHSTGIPPTDHGLQFLPDSLRYLHWDGYPWKSFPSGFRPRLLVELVLPNSKVNKLWEGSKYIGCLKKIDLGYSKHLKTLPDLSGASKLEHVYLEYCTSLQEIPSYFQQFNELKTLILEGCSSVREFPKVPKSIVCLVMSETAIKRVPSSIGHLHCLEILKLNYCRKLKSLPNYGISKLMLEKLKAVTLEGTSLSHHELPWWIEYIIAHSSLSLYHHISISNIDTECSRTRVFPLRPLSKVKSSPELPLFGFSKGSNCMSIEMVSTSTKGLCMPIQVIKNMDIAASKKVLFYNCLQFYERGRSYDEMCMSARKLKFISSKIAWQEFSRGLRTNANIGFCCRGNEIPKWFQYQLKCRITRNKLKVEMELPPDSLNPKLVGFAVCVCGDIFNPNHFPRKVKLLCKPCFVMNNGSTLSWDFYCYNGTRYANGRVGEDWFNFRDMISTVEFEFSVLTADRSDPLFGGDIINCGIHPIYEEDAKTFGRLLINQQDYRKALDEEEFWKLEVEEEEWKLLVEYEERKLLVMEEERKRLEEEKRKRLVEEEERKRLVEEKRKRLVEEEERKRLVEEEEERKLAAKEGEQDSILRSFNLEDLLRASAEWLGRGSVGTSYKAVLEQGITVVVKRLKDVVVSKKEFETQMEGLGNIKHDNVVPLRDFYYSKDEKLLIYDFMPAHSFSALLHGSSGSGRTPLDWDSRKRITIGAARGLAHLHVSEKIVHGNIKSSNILLRPNHDACVSEFGLHQLFGSSTPPNRVAGYRAPEILETRKFTFKSDVYSFGVLLLELLTGKAPNQASLGEEGIDLPRWVQSVVREEWTAEVFDVELMRYHNIEEDMVQLLQIAMSCVSTVPDQRPDMQEVLLMMEDMNRGEERKLLVEEEEEEEEKRKLLVEEEGRKLLVVQEKRKLLVEEERRKLLVEQEKRKLLAEEERRKLLVEEERRKLLVEQEKRKLLAEEERRKLLVEQEKRKLLAEEERRKLLVGQEKRKLLAEEERRKLLVGQEKRKLLAEEERRKLLVGQEKRKLLAEEERRKLLVEQEKRKLLAEEEKRKLLVKAEEKRKLSVKEDGRKLKAKEELVFLKKKKDSMCSFDLEDVLRASAEVLGRGSIGTSYKAVLEQGITVVVKRLKDVVVSNKELETLTEGLGNVKHDNVVPFLAFYSSKDDKLLVYDFMPTGSLSAFLHGSRGSGPTPLDWDSRKQIAIGAARGLAHLHVSEKIVHGNIKSSNILLRPNHDACVSDFGLHPLFGTSTPPNQVAGYRASEVLETREFTFMSDVYSFGVLLLELLTGKAPNQASLAEEGIDLPGWVQSVDQEECTAEVFDLELLRYHNIEEEMVQLLQIAMSCVSTVPDQRPGMQVVLRMMEDMNRGAIDDRLRQSSDDPSKGSDGQTPPTESRTPPSSITP